ncbi:MAG: GNAT family N-acetyltransferase [Pseudomonadota bacterium]
MAASDFAHITTPRLHLIPVTEADPAEVAQAIGNYDVARWLGRVPYPYGPDDARAFIEANVEQEGRVWFVRDAEGIAGGVAIDRELGYWLARSAWGQGYATEMADAAVDVHFQDTPEEGLESNHFPGNDRSARVLLKLGFQYTGERPVKSLALAQTIESRAMTLSRERWRARREILIKTPRLLLRTLTPRDWPRLSQIGGVPEVARMMTHLTAPWPETAVRHWITTGAFRGRPGYRLGMALDDGALIGAVGLGPDRSLAIMVDRRYWGRGLATEAAGALVADAFERFPTVDHIEADHFTDNPASGAVLRKLGFEQFGTGLGASKARVERAPNVLYRLSRDRLRLGK